MRGLLRGLAAFALTVGCVPHHVATTRGDEHWVGSWEAPPQLVEPNNMPPSPGLTGVTLRQVIHTSLGGSRWRVRLSNEFGDGTLVIGAARVARATERDAIDRSTDVPLSFGGKASVSVAAGGFVTSDPFDLGARAFSNVALSLYVASAPAKITGHPGSRATSYLAPGNRAADEWLASAVTTDHWYLASGLEVSSASDVASVVVLGNSIADGRGSTTNGNDRWPDNLARRLASIRPVGVLNAGIGGNAVLRGGLGPTALDRLERDVLSQPGARWLIVSEGVNDIGTARGPDASATVARELIAAYGDILRRAHQRGLRVYGATILPFGGSFYDSAEHEAARAAVNAWIRQSGAFDAVIDCDAAMRDPANPNRLQAAADGGDHLHPNALGYRMMSDAIDLSLFAIATSGQF